MPSGSKVKATAPSGRKVKFAAEAEVPESVSEASESSEEQDDSPEESEDSQEELADSQEELEDALDEVMGDVVDEVVEDVLEELDPNWQDPYESDPTDMSNDDAGAEGCDNHNQLSDIDMTDSDAEDDTSHTEDDALDTLSLNHLLSSGSPSAAPRPPDSGIAIPEDAFLMRTRGMARKETPSEVSGEAAPEAPPKSATRARSRPVSNATPRPGAEAASKTPEPVTKAPPRDPPAPMFRTPRTYMEPTAPTGPSPAPRPAAPRSAPPLSGAAACQTAAKPGNAGGDVPDLKITYHPIAGDASHVGDVPDMKITHHPIAGDASHGGDVPHFKITYHPIAGDSSHGAGSETLGFEPLSSVSPPPESLKAPKERYSRERTAVSTEESVLLKVPTEGGAREKSVSPKTPKERSAREKSVLTDNSASTVPASSGRGPPSSMTSFFTPHSGRKKAPLPRKKLDEAIAKMRQAMEPETKPTQPEDGAPLCPEIGVPPGCDPLKKDKNDIAYGHSYKVQVEDFPTVDLRTQEKYLATDNRISKELEDVRRDVAGWAAEYFGSKKKSDKEWAYDFGSQASEELLRLIQGVAVAPGMGTAEDWERLLLDDEQRAAVVEGVFWLVMREHVFGSLLFGAQVEQLKILKADELRYVNADAFKRTAERGLKVRKFLGVVKSGPALYPDYFAEMAASLTASLYKLFRPMLPVWNERQADQKRNDFLAEMHDYVVRCARLSVLMRLDCATVYMMHRSSPLGQAFDGDQADFWSAKQKGQLHTTNPRTLPKRETMRMTDTHIKEMNKRLWKLHPNKTIVTRVWVRDQIVAYRQGGWRKGDEKKGFRTRVLSKGIGYGVWGEPTKIGQPRPKLEALVGQFGAYA
ncbi:hypothetical protein EJ06DRAFT_555453 [Trichodelitschia bisporula]|uniref:Uncharacterized protein n=1 Tax=Trichodelitschia bisporula TaxID=703511 RepID=A0A6G1I0H1_9PEZI|nr:hypothetical protein EJ06DRAFT_555453 [Trichodelitschia bisporula]